MTRIKEGDTISITSGLFTSQIAKVFAVSRELQYAEDRRLCIRFVASPTSTAMCLESEATLIERTSS